MELLLTVSHAVASHAVARAVKDALRESKSVKEPLTDLGGQCQGLTARGAAVAFRDVFAQVGGASGWDVGSAVREGHPEGI